MSNLSVEKRRRMMERYLGPLITGALQDALVTDVFVNDDGHVFLRCEEGNVDAERYLELRHLDLSIAPIAGNDLRQFALLAASYLGEEITDRRPSLGGELPWGEIRFQIFAPPATELRHNIALRKLPTKLYPLSGAADAYLEQEIITPEHIDAIHAAIDHRRSILVVGSMGSGKTTFANAILEAIASRAPRDRVAILQDTRELRCAAPNVISLRTTPDYALDGMTKDTLRSGADRVVVGEIRDQAALYLLDLWMSGHPGVATFHANSARQAVARLDALCRRESRSGQLHLIADAIGLIVVIRRVNEPRNRAADPPVWLNGLDALGDMRFASSLEELPDELSQRPARLGRRFRYLPQPRHLTRALPAKARRSVRWAGPRRQRR